MAASASTPVWCLVCGAHGGVDVTLNVLLFIPFAFGLRAAGVPTRRVVLLAAALSFFVESMQFAFITGRDASLSDLLTNTTGGIVGAALGGRLRTILLPPPATARTFAAGWAAAWLALWSVAAWLIQPWAPVTALRTAWGIDLPGQAAFQGRVHAVGGDLPAVPGPVADSLALPRRLAAGRLAFTVEAVTGPPTARPAPIVALIQDASLLGGVYGEHDNVVFELPARARQFRFRAPAIRLAGGLPSPGNPVKIAAAVRGRSLWVASAHGGARERQETLALSPSFGWALLLPFDHAFGPDVRLLTGLWIAGLLAPLGYWAGRGWTPGWRMPAGLAMVVTIGLAAIPRLGGYDPVPGSEWLAAAAGIGLGWAVARAGLYLGRRCASPSAGEFSSS